MDPHPHPQPPAEPPLTRPRPPEWSTWFIGALGAIAALIIYWRDGAARTVDIFTADAWLLLSLLPRVLAGTLLGALVASLLPKERVARVIGAESGLGGLLLASLFGALVPGGPFTLYPVAAALLAMGADLGAVVAFVTSWGLLGYARVLVWELPLMGVDFTVWRMLIAAPLVVLAGVLARVIVAVLRSRQPS